MTAKYAAALAVLSCLWTGPAFADDTSDAIKCLSVSLRLSAALTADDQAAAMLATMYWLGRLDGIVPKPDLEKLMQAGAFDMRPADEKAEAARCAAALQEGGTTLTKLGQELDQRQNSN